jgi:beta-ribofuranosylaminobenzene 5'-phosphate synthase
MSYRVHTIHAGRTAWVDTRARLHLGFLDIDGSLGRRFGSLGLSIDAFRTRLSARPAATTHASGPGAERATAFARQMLASLGVEHGVEIGIDTAIPDHMGLGSGTQLALAVGHAVAAACGVELGTREVAARLQRGARSGIGIGAFDQGGFIVDSGVGADGRIPPVTAQLPFPEAWRVLLVMDPRARGLSGKGEKSAFRTLPPFPAEIAARLCHLTLMQILPGVREACLDPVARGIAELQRCVGEHFAAAQGGCYTSRDVGDALDLAAALGFPGVGQSSWGPTGFVLLPDDRAARALVAEIERRADRFKPLRLVVTRGCNAASRITLDTAARLRESI